MHDVLVLCLSDIGMAGPGKAAAEAGVAAAGAGLQLMNAC